MIENCESCFGGRDDGCECGQECCRPYGLPEVIGIDPSMTCTGVVSYGSAERIRTTGKRTDTLTDRSVRMRAIADRINYIITVGDDPVDLVVIEGPSYASRDAGQWDRAGLWWSIVQPLLMGGTPVAVIPPACLKKYATGKGNAPKDQVMLAASKRYPNLGIVDNNTADAAVLYAMGCDWLKHQLESVPQVNRDALAKCDWPEGAVL